MISGAWPVVRFCSQISCFGALRVQLPVCATSSCAKPVAVLASSWSRATPVLAVFFTTAPEERLEDEGCDDGKPGFEKIDESGVGAEPPPDVDWELALKVPGRSRISIGKEDRSPAIVHGAIILWVPVRGLLSGTQFSFSREVVCV